MAARLATLEPSTTRAPAMQTFLPEYSPPNHQRAALAVGVSPLLVLLSFTLVVVRWLDVDSGFAIFAACTTWVVYEMHVFQAAIDRYNEGYVARHLAWRSSDALHAMASSPATPLSTQAFVGRFLLAHRMLLRDGQLP